MKHKRRAHKKKKHKRPKPKRKLRQCKLCRRFYPGSYENHKNFERKRGTKEHAEKKQPAPKAQPTKKDIKTYTDYLNSQTWKDIKYRKLLSKAKCEYHGGYGTEGNPLQIHHLNYTHWGHERPDDLMIVCKRCHLEIEMKKIKKPKSGIGKKMAEIGEIIFRGK